MFAICILWQWKRWTFFAVVVRAKLKIRPTTSEARLNRPLYLPASCMPQHSRVQLNQWEQTFFFLLFFVLQRIPTLSIRAACSFPYLVTRWNCIVCFLFWILSRDCTIFVYGWDATRTGLWCTHPEHTHEAIRAMAMVKCAQNKLYTHFLNPFILWLEASSEFIISVAIGSYFQIANWKLHTIEQCKIQSNVEHCNFTPSQWIFSFHITTDTHMHWQ